MNPSHWQSDVLWEQVFCAGRILRGEGHFEKAQQCFESCLGTSKLPEARKIHVASTLADLYCELDYQSERRLISLEEEYLVKAKAIIEPDFGCIWGHGRHSKGFRRLLLSSIEIEIKQDRRSEAESLIKELLKIYDELPEPDIVDRLGHVRALTLLHASPPCPTRKGGGKPHRSRTRCMRWYEIATWGSEINDIAPYEKRCPHSSYFV